MGFVDIFHGRVKIYIICVIIIKIYLKIVLECVHIKLHY